MAREYPIYSEKEIIDWINGVSPGLGSGERSMIPTRIKASDARKKELYLCPKSDKCIMDCPHKKPHTFDAFCDPESRATKEAYGDNPCECPKCVEELAADITFFEEDFEI
jgi:hypothetical protein